MARPRRFTGRTWKRISRASWTASSRVATRLRLFDGSTSRRGATRRRVGRSECPTFEDKVLQRAVTMVLEAVYEQDFLPSSYGFRPGRSAHQAIGELRKQIMEMEGGWL